MTETWLLRLARLWVRGFDAVLRFLAGRPNSVIEAFKMLKSDQDALTRHIHITLDAIDTKAGPQLSSVSMMTAIATLMLRVGNPTYVESVIFACATAIYLFLSLCCIRSLSYVDLVGRYGEGLNDTGGKSDLTVLRYNDDIKEEVLRRVTAINFVNAVMYPLTVIFALTVLLTVVT